MKVAPRIVIASLIASAIFALFSQELLMADGIGFNFAILSIVLVVIVLVMRSKKLIEPTFHPGYFVIPMGVVAFGFAVPDSRGLDALNMTVGLLSLGYCAMRCAAGKSLSLVESMGKVPAVVFAIPFAGPFLAFLADWKQAKVPKNLSTRRGAFVGALAAIPFLVIFGNVLAQADPMFGKIFSFNLNFNPDIVISRTVIFVFSMSFLAGLMIYFSPQMFARMNVAAGLNRDPSLPPPIMYSGSPLPKVETATQPSREGEHVATFVTFFGLIATMFLVFVLVQARYLFGGDSVVLKTEHLTYADYARRGFLEIVGVAAVCLPMLIFGQYSLKNFDEKLRKSVNVVLVIVVALLFLLLASATFRLRLYVGAYGLSPLRVYVAAGMLWLFTLFAAYLRNGLKWKLDPIGRFVFASMVMITMGLNLARPDYWIARVNLTRSEAKNLDPQMIIEAGADARSAVRDFGGEKMMISDKTSNIEAEYLKHLQSVPHGWKEMTISQMSSLQK